MLRQICAAGALALAGACSTTAPLVGGDDARVNYAAGSPLGAQIDRGQARALAAAFVAAMDGGDATDWRDGDASGAVRPGVQKVGNLRFDPAALLDFEPGLRLSRSFETDLGEFVLTRNANVRYGPSTDYDVVETLDSGDGVEVVGRVVDAPWMLIAIDQKVRGFVYEELMVRRPGSELELAGGPTRRPLLCRPFEQTMTVAGVKDQWTGVACKEEGGWRLPPPVEGAPTRLF
ncbi:MAG: SH3 domain-containing protein [Pseudomonadota bacterium]